MIMASAPKAGRNPGLSRSAASVAAGYPTAREDSPKSPCWIWSNSLA